MGLADAGRAADEERVVGLGRHLRDGQRGRVGETVAVADHELLEGQLGVAEGPGSVRRRGWRRGGRTPADGIAPGLLGCFGQLQLPAGAERELDARLDRAAVALLDPSARVCGHRHHDRLLAQLERTQRLQPDLVGGLVHRQRQLGLDVRPNLLEVVVHGSVLQLLPRSGQRHY